MSAGSAERVRLWWLGLIAGNQAGFPPELLSKLRLFESVMPILSRLVGFRDVRSIADLLPDDDAEATALLELLHRWSGQMLAVPLPPASAGGTPADADASGPGPSARLSEENHGTNPPL